MTKKTKHSTSKPYELLGWVGVVLVLASYFLLSLGLVEGSSYTYHLLVLGGSLFVAVISFRKRALQPAILNITFAFLATVAIIRLFLINL